MGAGARHARGEGDLPTENATFVEGRVRRCLVSPSVRDPLVDTPEGRCYQLRPLPARPARSQISEDVVKRTFQPHRKSRKRTHGFRKRMKTRSGREVIRRRRRKGRRQLTVTVAKK